MISTWQNMEGNLWWNFPAGLRTQVTSVAITNQRRTPSNKSPLWFLTGKLKGTSYKKCFSPNISAADCTRYHCQHLGGCSVADLWPPCGQCMRVSFSTGGEEEELEVSWVGIWDNASWLLLLYKTAWKRLDHTVIIPPVLYEHVWLLPLLCPAHQALKVDCGHSDLHALK